MDTSTITRAPLPAAPLLAPWLHCGGDGNGLLFGYGDEVVTLAGRAASTLLPRLLPLLDGHRDVDQLVAAVGEAARPAVEAALGVLVREGLVVEGPAVPEGHPAREAAYLVAGQTLRTSPYEVVRSLEGVSVEVRGGGTTAAAVARALHESGLSATTVELGAPLDEHDLVVVAPRPDELPSLRAWNRRALDDGVTWLAVLPFDGAKAFVGPLFLPRESACFECLSVRRAANLPFAAEYRQLEREPASFPVAACVDATLAGLAALAVLRWLGAGDPLFAGAAYVLEIGAELSLSRHAIYPVPRCPECSPYATASPVSPWYG